MDINGHQYNKVNVYQNDSARINDCAYFVYSAEEGGLKYMIKRNNSSENWVLTP